MSAGSAPGSGLGHSIPTSLAAPAVMRVGARTVVAAEPAEVLCLDGEAALHALDRLDHGWWAGFLSFDLGRSIERITPRPLPDVRTHTSDRRSVVPDLLVARYDARLEIDGSDARMLGSAPARRRLEHLLASAPAVAAHEHLGTATSSLSHDEYTERVRAVLALLEAGDCYQVNLTRRLRWDNTPDPVAMFHAVTEANPAPHGSLLVLPQPGAETIAIVSASPERFLAWRTDATGRVVETRPIKGTGRNPDALRTSAKNRAENVMIVDLARNDLGRVCEFGTIHVPDSSISRAHSALTPSSTSHSEGAPRFAAGSRWRVRRLCSRGRWRACPAARLVKKSGLWAGM